LVALPSALLSVMFAVWVEVLETWTLPVDLGEMRGVLSPMVII